MHAAGVGIDDDGLFDTFSASSVIDHPLYPNMPASPMILLGRISEKLVLVIDFVLLNASALLVAADIAKDYVEDTKFARESLMSTTLMASIV